VLAAQNSQQNKGKASIALQAGHSADGYRLNDNI